MAGRKEPKPLTMKALVSERLFPARGRRTYVTLTLRKDREGTIVASPVGTGASGAVTTLSKADGFLIIREDQQFIEKGSRIDVELFKLSGYASLMREKAD